MAWSGLLVLLVTCVSKIFLPGGGFILLVVLFILFFTILAVIIYSDRKTIDSTQCVVSL